MAKNGISNPIPGAIKMLKSSVFTDTFYQHRISQYAVLTQISIILMALNLNAQAALYNNGNLRIHKNGKLGFHTHYINDMPCVDNMGLAGFYGERRLLVSGAYPPAFYDVEIFNPQGLQLAVSLEVGNNLNFIHGDILTNENEKMPAVKFHTNASFTGSTASSKVRGWVKVADRKEFNFPVGDGDHLHPLKMMASTNSYISRCTYFEGIPQGIIPNPASAVVQRKEQIEGIFHHGYWMLEGTDSVKIRLLWNSESEMAQLAGDIKQITLAGWHKIRHRWETLGPVHLQGNLTQGQADSGAFIPDEFAAITFARLKKSNIAVDAGNFLITPNGDGINDFLEIPVTGTSPRNHIKIYNRYGQKVFDLEDYINQFEGTANGNRLIFNPEFSLPGGIYFYLLELIDLGVIHQGFLYLER